MPICRICGIDKDVAEFTPRNDTKRGCRSECKICVANRFRDRYYRKRRGISTRLRVDAIMARGGACEACGYSKSFEALCFHHRQPFEKKFKLDSSGFQKSRSSVLAEVAKCSILCANCHAELHEHLRAEALKNL